MSSVPTTDPIKMTVRKTTVKKQSEHLKRHISPHTKKEAGQETTVEKDCNKISRNKIIQAGGEKQNKTSTNCVATLMERYRVG